jgi:lycopene cyclase domain-containing protein
MLGHSTYLFVLGITFIAPFILGFHPSVAFNRQWQKILRGIFWIALLYLPWDMLKTYFGVWSFNDAYISGIFLTNLPLEEVLFFVATPFACLFSYACVQYYWPKQNTDTEKFKKPALWGLITLIVLALLVLRQNITGWYTTSAVAVAIAMSIWAYTRLSKRQFFLGLLTWAILLLPFYICNGILTGIAFWEYPFWNTEMIDIKDAVVLYNNAENASIRIWSVPLEDFFYGIGFYWISVLNWER